MPLGLFEEENSVSAQSDFGCDLIEMKLHSFSVAGRKHEGGAGSAFGAERTEQYSRMIRSHARQRATPRIAGIRALLYDSGEKGPYVWR